MSGLEAIIAEKKKRAAEARADLDAAERERIRLMKKDLLEHDESMLPVREQELARAIEREEERAAERERSRRIRSIPASRAARLAAERAAKAENTERVRVEWALRRIQNALTIAARNVQIVGDEISK